ncbi:hypothetical protein, partial [Coprococcus eutactus]|uniref:hypothetical protein n=1 Tax=Coprococcus eutactus TaxID=33043 RepID=UPI00210F0175
LEGKAGDTGLTLTEASVRHALTATTGYNLWTRYETDTFTLDSTEDITITISGTLATDYCVDIDNIKLYKIT